MVYPHPDLLNRIINTDKLVKSNRAGLVPEFYGRSPLEYIDLDAYVTLERNKPWVDRIITVLIAGTQQYVDNVLVLCVDFNDSPSIINISDIKDRFFTDNEKSFYNYYKSNSYSTYIPKGEVHGWYRAPNNLIYYTNGNNGFGNYPQNAQRLVEDVLEIAKNDTNINWASFDTNNNGSLDSIIIIHAGAEAAYTGRLNDLWAHTWNIYSTKTIQGKTVSAYSMSAEYLSKDNLLQRCGVDCHEFGHLLGLPDLYDISGNSNGVGIFSIMASGSWANDALTPTCFDAWSKYKLGYTTTNDNPNVLVNLGDAETNNISIKYSTNDVKEYFLIENRQRILFDLYLPGDGILIWHINENQTDNTNTNCYLVGLVQADGTKDLENGTNSGDSGDFYPGSSNNRSFGYNTNPSSSLCNGLLNISLTDISNSSNIMSYNSKTQVPVVQAGIGSSLIGELLFLGIVVGTIYSYLKNRLDIDTRVTHA